jgi:hypothetical protein
MEPGDIDELRKYAEFRRARHLMEQNKLSARGRKG